VSAKVNAPYQRRAVGQSDENLVVASFRAYFRAAITKHGMANCVSKLPTVRKRYVKTNRPRIQSRRESYNGFFVLLTSQLKRSFFFPSSFSSTIIQKSNDGRPPPRAIYEIFPGTRPAGDSEFSAAYSGRRFSPLLIVHIRWPNDGEPARVDVRHLGPWRLCPYIILNRTRRDRVTPSHPPLPDVRDIFQLLSNEL